jgi:hypothetical protein
MKKNELVTIVCQHYLDIEYDDSTTLIEALRIIEEKAEENSDYDDDGNLIEGDIDKDDLPSWRNSFLAYICDEWEELAK